MVEPDGSILVTHNEGRLMRVSPDGQVTLLLDTTVIGQNLADFTFNPRDATWSFFRPGSTAG